MNNGIGRCGMLLVLLPDRYLMLRSYSRGQSTDPEFLYDDTRSCSHLAQTSEPALFPPRFTSLSHFKLVTNISVNHTQVVDGPSMHLAVPLCSLAAPMLSKALLLAFPELTWVWKVASLLPYSWPQTSLIPFCSKATSLKQVHPGLTISLSAERIGCGALSSLFSPITSFSDFPYPAQKEDKLPGDASQATVTSPLHCGQREIESARAISWVFGLCLLSLPSPFASNFITQDSGPLSWHVQAAVLGYRDLLKDTLCGTKAANIMYPNSAGDNEYFYVQTEQLHPHYL